MNQRPKKKWTQRLKNPTSVSHLSLIILKNLLVTSNYLENKADHLL